jgi:hypothetical protein
MVILPNIEHQNDGVFVLNNEFLADVKNSAHR